jgi:hypothetical protein
MCSGVAKVITAMMDRQPMTTHFRGCPGPCAGWTPS